MKICPSTKIKGSFAVPCEGRWLATQDGRVVNERIDIRYVRCDKLRFLLMIIDRKKIDACINYPPTSQLR